MTDDLRVLTAEIVPAHIGNNDVGLSELPTLIRCVHNALSEAIAPPPPPPSPAVPLRSSVRPDYLVSLESGRRLKSLTRYLMANYGMTRDEYRRKWGLPYDYPMAAPNVVKRRREHAAKVGFGARRQQETPSYDTSAAEGAPTPASADGELGGDAVAAFPALADLAGSQTAPEKLPLSDLELSQGRALA